MTAVSRSIAEAPALGEVLEFLRLVWTLDHTLQRASRQLETTLGLTGPQRLVIRIVGRLPGVPAGQLAGLLHVHPGTLTGMLKRLERRGLIRRRSDPRDGRRALLGLTARGRDLDVEAGGTVEAAIRNALATAAPEKIQATREVLESIGHAIEETLSLRASEPDREWTRGGA